MSVDDLAQAVGLSRSTAYRLLRVLEDELYVVHQPPLGYRLGSRLVGLAAAALPEFDLYVAVRPVLRELSHDSGETVTLHRRVGDLSILVLGEENQAQSLRRVAHLGEASLLVRGAAGQAILAHLDQEEAAQIIARTVIDEDRRSLLTSLSRIRDLGCAVSHGANHPGVNGIAATIRSTEGRSDSTSIAVSGPATRWTDERMLAFATRLNEACEQLREIFERGAVPSMQR
jgi:DNA-binding IclR family transcriptional regulator